MIDLHCHILPGLDDGPTTFDEALQMARLAAADGVRTIVATPHLDEHYQQPAPQLIRDLTARLNELIAAERLPLTVLPGAEVRTAPELLEALAAGRVMTVADQGRYLLLELPASGHAGYAGELFFRLQLAGYTPIIAHVERVDLFRRELHWLRDFKDRNIRLQVNADSLSGHGGRIIRNHALRLVKEGLVDVVSSDGHSTKSRKPLLTVARKPLRGQPGLFEMLTTQTPASFLGDGQQAAPGRTPPSLATNP